MGEKTLSNRLQALYGPYPPQGASWDWCTSEGETSLPFSMRTHGSLYFDVDKIVDEIFAAPSSVRELAPAMHRTKQNVDMYACQASGVDAEP
eukprot:7973156-Karenia_brevis.AAC.1